jgi:sensor histidine kinase YesM
LSLMQIRLGQRLRCELTLPPELACVKVPTLILQSLVENAVVHGLEPKVGGGNLWVSAAQSAGQLVLQVKDDGLGFDSKAASGQAHNGFGLAQVRERLQSRYGSLATIDFIAICAMNTKPRDVFGLNGTAPVATPGCQVTLRIPIHV